MQKSFKALPCALLLLTASHAVLAANNETNTPMGIKVGMGFDQGFGVTAQFEDRMNVFLGNDGLAADYIVKRGSFTSDIPFDWYVGIGAAINWDNNYSHAHSDGTWHDEDYNNYSVRVPLGLNFPFATRWDVYGQVAPALEFKNKPHDSEFQFGLDLGIGIRYAF